MSQSENPTSSSIPSHTTPTWEMELLISGVTVFAMLQLPGLMDQAYLALSPRLDQDWEALSRLLFTYSKMSVLILSAAFVLHLSLRGYWVALVGMNSIYPDGVVWDRLKVGSIQRRWIERRGISMADRIESADNRASIVFALGVTMALTMIGLVLFVAAGFAIAAPLSWMLGWDWGFRNGSFLLIGMVTLPYALAHFFDQRFGARLSPEGWSARAISKVFSTYSSLGYSSDTNPTMKLLQSHVGARKVFAATFIAVMLVAFFATGQLILQQTSINLGAYALWPEAIIGADDSVIDQHYRDQSGEDNFLLPTIDSMFPSGGYLSLIVPFNPKRDPGLLAAACPEAWQTAHASAQRGPLLDCMTRLQELQLDGQVMQPLAPHYYTAPRTGQHGMLIVIPIGNLAVGEHSLSLNRAQAVDRDDRNGKPDRYQIAFWK